VAKGLNWTKSKNDPDPLAGNKVRSAKNSDLPFSVKDFLFASLYTESTRQTCPGGDDQYRKKKGAYLGGSCRKQYSIPISYFAAKFSVDFKGTVSLV
jgi:hypothetical protein